MGSVTARRSARSGTVAKTGVGTTDADGRVGALAGESGIGPGVYLLIFDTETPFFEQVIVTFSVTEEDERLHIPLLLSPYGYTVYRGS